MKALKIIAMLAFIIGFIVIAGAIGTDDFYIMELHQPHTLDAVRIAAGMLLCFPILLVNNHES